MENLWRGWVNGCREIGQFVQCDVVGRIPKYPLVPSFAAGGLGRGLEYEEKMFLGTRTVVDNLLC